MTFIFIIPCFSSEIFLTWLSIFTTINTEKEPSYEESGHELATLILTLRLYFIEVIGDENVM